MFYSCLSLVSLVVKNFITDSVIDMQNMFFKCAKLKKLDLSYSIFLCPPPVEKFIFLWGALLEDFVKILKFF